MGRVLVIARKVIGVLSLNVKTIDDDRLATPMIIVSSLNYLVYTRPTDLAIKNLKSSHANALCSLYSVPPNRHIFGKWSWSTDHLPDLRDPL